MENKQNISYVFIPFCLNGRKQFNQTIKALESHEDWKKTDINLRYMMKYITDKLNAGNIEKCRCFCYDLKEESGVKYGLAAENPWYRIEEGACFQLQNIQLYCFDTEVCVMVFRIEFEDKDPFNIASALYQLKKASRTRFWVEDAKEQMTFLDAARKIADNVTKDVKLQPFFYMEEAIVRANVLTYLEVEERESFDKELYYLKRCYNERFLYYEDQKQKEREFFSTTPDVMWGITPEAAVCLTRPELGRKEFIQNTFFNNFKEQYLFMYLLVLHQKYVLYLFLTRIGGDGYDDLDKLEEYKKRLHDFEREFVFSNITEVPQYQKLYEKLLDIHELHKMYDDIREPLDALNEMQREQLEKEQKQRERKMNKALFLLSILTLFSALADSYQFADEFLSSYLSDGSVLTVQWISIAVILGIVIYIVILLNKKEK